MLRTQSLNPIGARPGLDALVKAYSNKELNFWQKITKTLKTEDLYFLALTEGDLGPATTLGGNAGQAPSQVTGEAMGINYDDFQTPFNATYYPFKRGVGFATTTEAEESDRYGIIKKVAAKMSKAMCKTREADMANFLNLATSTGFVGPDGQPLASTSHPLDVGVYSNILNAAAGASSYTALALGPLSLEQAIQEIQVQQSHRGDPMMYMGPYRLYVPNSLNGYANRIVTASGLAGTNTWDKNWGGTQIKDILPDPYFTSTVAWALRSMNDDEHGLAYIERRADRSREQYDIDKDVNKRTLTAIWIKAILDWRGFILGGV